MDYQYLNKETKEKREDYFIVYPPFRYDQAPLPK